jgi:MerR family mercuric resistance operon transcriptional regulator
METITIGKVARLAAVGVETLRFYEREGLIEKPRRRDSGYRAYPASTVDRVRFIRRAKELGFSLKEIKELLELRISPDTTCGEIKTHAESKIGDIDDKIKSLRSMKKALQKLTDACGGSGPVSECPILDALDQGKEQ